MPALLYFIFVPGAWTSAVSFRLATVSASDGDVASK
jgi:hypothetical protein